MTSTKATKGLKANGCTPLYRKVQIKGKYLDAIAACVSSLTLSLEWLPPNSKALLALADVIVRMQPAFQSKTFAASFLLREFVRFVYDHNDRTGELGDPANADLKKALIAKLVAQVESLPRKYILRIELPSFGKLLPGRYRISDSAWLVEEPFNFAPVTRSARMGRSLGLADRSTNTHLELHALGFANQSPESPAAAEMISLAKQCAFILSNGSIARTERNGQTARAKLTDALNDETTDLSIPHSLASCFGSMVVNKAGLQVDESAGSHDPLAVRTAQTMAERSETLARELRRAGEIFDASGQPDYASLCAAIEWYHDACYSDNQTLAYLAACIGLEALLGGGDEHLDDMSRRLADRYAYMLGKARSARQTLQSDYLEILKVRGRLVHARDSRLSGDALGSLGRATNMLARVIQHELEQFLRQMRHTKARQVDPQGH